MPREILHRFEHDGKRFAIDPETCFCFECDAISWDVLEHYPQEPVNRVYQLLGDKYCRKELSEVVGELEWLRATKSILTPPKREDVLKIYEVERGLKQVAVALSREAPPSDPARRGWFGKGAAAAPGAAREIGRETIGLLLSRSGAQKDLAIEFVEDQYVHSPDLIAELCAYALKAGRLSGKNLTAAVHVTNLALAKPPEALRDHAVGVRIEFQDASGALDHLRALAQPGEHALSRLAKVIQPAAPGVTGRIVVRPIHPKFGGVVEELDSAGFAIIELDLDGAFVTTPDLDPQAMLEGLSRSAVYYAQRLLKHHYFRLDPIASLFWRIYTGSPLRRSDPAGTNELAVGAQGAIYPCRRMVGVADMKLGSITDGTLDEESVRRFDDVGSLTTPECIRCWARNLCGGGPAAVHQAFTGSFRKPHEPWCDMQRSWMAAAVSAFQMLSSAGVHFERVYKALGRKDKPSLFTQARAMLTMTIGVRPIEEADAELLTRWENWNETAYFLFTETGLLLATKYDREMDSLHPRGIDQELVLIRRTGEPFGLFKVRPERLSGVARGWLYMRDGADYASDAVRKGFRAILKEASAQQAIRKLLVPVSPKEHGLQGFLEATGFEREGILREALYLHGAYHDITVYSLTTDLL
jgi:uncharacterized protein